MRRITPSWWAWYRGRSRRTPIRRGSTTRTTGSSRLVVQGRYVGDRFEDDANQFPIGSLFVVDVTASKVINDWISIFANVENALDQDYEVRVTSTLIEIGSPRWFYGGVRLSF